MNQEEITVVVDKLDVEITQFKFNVQKKMIEELGTTDAIREENKQLKAKVIALNIEVKDVTIQLLTAQASSGEHISLPLSQIPPSPLFLMFSFILLILFFMAMFEQILLNLNLVQYI